MVQWNLKGYVVGSILIQTERGEGVKEGIWIPHIYEVARSQLASKPSQDTKSGTCDKSGLSGKWKGVCGLI